MDLSKLTLPEGASLTLVEVQPGATHIGHVDHYYESENKGRRRASNTTVATQQQKDDILAYVDRLSDQLTDQWSDIYGELWQNIIDLPSVSTEIFNPGKQQDTTFNRNLVARIIRLLGSHGAFGIRYNAQHLTELLEGTKDHSVRAQLGYKLDSPIMISDIETKIKSMNA